MSLETEADGWNLARLVGFGPKCLSILFHRIQDI
jgi:hypothetical protein